jgi:phosphate uptake regulator
MFSTEQLDENFRTLVFEVRKQVEDTLKALRSPSPELIEKVAAEGDYVDNLKNVIRLKIYKRLARAEQDDRLMINQVMAVETITINLERIGDFCENIVRQLNHLTDRSYFMAYDYQRYFDQILSALERIEQKIIEKGNVHDALNLCKVERELDAFYAEDFRSLLRDLDQPGRDSGNIVTTIFILRYLERIGDALLNIGEAFLSSITGRKLKIEQYLSMVETLHNGLEFTIEGVGSDTRSGCRIEKVRPVDSSRDAVIFKEGKRKKLLEEKEQLEKWQDIFPGLTPKVLAFEERGENATLLLEFIRGFTFQEIMLTGNLEATRHALEVITGFLNRSGPKPFCPGRSTPPTSSR